MEIEVGRIIEKCSVDLVVSCLERIFLPSCIATMEQEKRSAIVVLARAGHGPADIVSICHPISKIPVVLES